MKRLAIVLLTLTACSGQTEPEQNTNVTEPNPPADSVEAVVDTLVTEPAAIDSTSKALNIVDYYHMLPGWLFMCDGIGNEDSEQFRNDAIVEQNVGNGYIRCNPMGFYEIDIALFKDRENNKDYIMTSIICGMGCMCNHMAIYSPDEDGNLTEDWSVIPESERENFMNGIYVVVVPNQGTVVPVYDAEVYNNPDADGMELFRLLWENGTFEIGEPVYGY